MIVLIPFLKTEPPNLKNVVPQVSQFGRESPYIRGASGKKCGISFENEDGLISL